MPDPFEPARQAGFFPATVFLPALIQPSIPSAMMNTLV
jgi:hypothetical protein